MVRGHVNLATRSIRALAARTIQHLWSRQVDCSSRARCASRTFSSGRRPRQLAACNLFTLLLHALPVHSCMSLMPDSSLRSGRSCRKCARSRRCVYIDESINRLGDIAAESGRIPKGAFVRWAMQLLSATVQRGNTEMYRRSGLVISREEGLRDDARFAVPVLMS